MKILLPIAAFLLLLTLGCASSQKARDDQKVIPNGSGYIVEVDFYDSKIHMPTNIPSGMITFRVSNPSDNDHNFKISGNGIEQQLAHDIQEGGKEDLTLNLSPGEYRVICPMLSHPDLGERLTLTVK